MWISPTHGYLTLPQVFEKITQFIRADNTAQYEISVGCDSQNHKAKRITRFSIAIAVHRVGNGGIYFYKTFTKPIVVSIKQRLWEEAGYGVTAASDLIEIIDKNHLNYDINFHVDVNVSMKTESNKVANEIINYVRACGIDKVYPKPYGFTASAIADRHSK